MHDTCLQADILQSVGEIGNVVEMLETPYFRGTEALRER